MPATLKCSDMQSDLSSPFFKPRLGLLVMPFSNYVLFFVMALGMNVHATLFENAIKAAVDKIDHCKSEGIVWVGVGFSHQLWRDELIVSLQNMLVKTDRLDASFRSCRSDYDIIDTQLHWEGHVRAFVGLCSPMLQDKPAVIVPHGVMVALHAVFSQLLEMQIELRFRAETTKALFASVREACKVFAKIEPVKKSARVFDRRFTLPVD